MVQEFQDTEKENLKCTQKFYFLEFILNTSAQNLIEETSF